MKELSFTEIITKNLISIVLALFFLPVVVFGQDYEEKFYADDGRNPGGDVIIKKSSIKIDGDYAYRIFEVEAHEAGPYYLSAWLMASTTDKGLREYKVQINGSEHLTLKPEKANWQSVTFKDENQNLAFAELRAGLNTIAFLTQVPEIPMVEFIRLSKDQEKANIQGTEYEAFLSDINKETEARKNNPTPERDSLISLKNGIVLPNPEGNYYHHLEATFKYTFYTTVYLQAGQQAFFATNANNFKHVLEVFSYNETESYSWVATSTSDGLASINVNIPYTDTYFVRVRSYWQDEQGLVNLNVNGQYYYEDCTASGWAGFRHFHTTPVEYNYFTCHINGDTRLWIEDSGLPGRIIGWNDDYWGSGDFSWGLASRVKRDFSTNVGAALFSSYSSYTPTGTCDLYIKCGNSDIMSYFPNLEADDAIQSASSSGTYNCISWSGGITNDWYWPPSPYDPYYAGNPLASFDNFYGTVRYTGAMTYSRSGATSSNNTVDLWALNGDYTHGSVTKHGNNHPHGYDWESKPGGLMRTFHPRHSLNGSSYGTVDKYYKITSGLKSAMLLDESIARGLSVIENVEFTANEKQVISESINKLSFDQKSNLETKYQVWKETWENMDVIIHSNPRMYANNEEYSDFIEYCKTLEEESWPFIFSKFEQGDFFVINALEDLTLADNMDILEKVKTENNLKSKSTSGATIVRSPRINAMKYIKELLKSTGLVTSAENDGIIYSNSFDFNVFPNPADGNSQLAFNLPDDAKVSAELIDLSGRTLSVVIERQTLKAGPYMYILNIPENIHGVFLVKLLVNNNVNVKRIVVQ